MKLETAKRLHDAAQACAELQEITAGRTKEEFLIDRLRKLAVWKLIEIVGEALRQAALVDDALTARIPDLRLIVDTRNRITHGYDSVNFSVLWDIVQDEIPPLHLVLTTLLLDAPDITGGKKLP